MIKNNLKPPPSIFFGQGVGAAAIQIRRWRPGPVSHSLPHLFIPHVHVLAAKTRRQAIPKREAKRCLVMRGGYPAIFLSV